MIASCAAAASGKPAATPAGPGRTESALTGLHAAGPRYYLALGDSLSQGVQPGPGGASVSTANGYPQQLDVLLRRRDPSLRLVLMGCSGETTSTMIHGGICHYQRRSQLAQAVGFLRAHRGQVALITIDIGANDPNSCVLGARLSAMPSCLWAGATSTVRNLGTILARLRAAGGSKIPIAGMTYYVPELGLWLTGKTGTELAVLSERLAVGYNNLLTAEYRRFGARVANVFGAFHGGDFTDRIPLRGHGLVPRNVAAICSLTWMCARPPLGPNEHANAAGYQIIAQAFLTAIAR